MRREYNLADLLKRPELSLNDLYESGGYQLNHRQAQEQIEISAKYAGYIDRQKNDIEKLQRHENTLIPSNININDISGLSNEVKQKLIESRPENLGRASRVPGVTPAAISLLLVHLKKLGHLDAADKLENKQIKSAL